METREFFFQDIKIKITYKKIKSIILKIKNLNEIEVSCPPKTSESLILKFINQKEKWIKESFVKLPNKVNLNTKYQFSEGEMHFFLGKRYPLKIKDSKDYCVVFDGENIIIKIPVATSKGARERLLNSWYLERLKEICNISFEKWELKTNLIKTKLVFEKMKGKWGYCNFVTKVIYINTEIIKKDTEFIDYVILHEICHLQVPNHGVRFKKLLNTFLPNWKIIQKVD